MGDEDPLTDKLFEQRDDLRRRAEHKLGRFLHPQAISGMDEARAFIRELRIHQVELEIQNEELILARQELELARDQLASLYDHAPVAYLTLEPKGRIVQANITAATLLGVPRPVLTASRLYNFIIDQDQGAYFAQRKAMQQTGSAPHCDVCMQREDGSRFQARMESTPECDANGDIVAYRVVIIDITPVEITPGPAD
jgi:PAS domain S-box-containing protein